MVSIPLQLGYGALFGLVFAESAGVPVPGETALIAAAVLAGTGHLALWLVIAVAASAAITGDALGYWLGRRGGRAVLLSRGPLMRHRRHALERGEAFFARHGAKAVFAARWIPGVRVAGAVIAGASRMPWRTFVTYNVAGALVWATTVGGLASLVGPGVAATASIVAIALTAAAAIGFVLRGRRRRRPIEPRPAGAAAG